MEKAACRPFCAVPQGLTSRSVLTLRFPLALERGTMSCTPVIEASGYLHKTHCLPRAMPTVASGLSTAVNFK